MSRFFSTGMMDGRWWILTPDGDKFLTLGVNHVTYKGDHAPTLGYSPYNRAVTEKYGNEEAWAKASVDRLRSWNFNTIGAWSSSSTFNKGMAYTLIINISSAAIRDAWLKGSFPDVFSEKFRDIAESVAESHCSQRAGDELLMGYFTDNELRWAADWRSKKALFDDFLAMSEDAPGKKRLVDFLVEKYGSRIADFNAVWRTNFQSFDHLFQVTDIQIAEETPGIVSDKTDFLRLVARQYFSVTSEAIKKYDSNHLILGCRFAGYAPDVVLEEMGKFVDVVSYNIYSPLPPVDRLERIHRLTGKPVMIGEFSFKAMDSGLPNTKGAAEPVATQQDRADGYEGFVTATLSLPYMVGVHWFEYGDEPAEGRFDGENSNYGVVNIKDEAYTTLTDKMTTVNAKAVKVASI